MKTFWTKFYWSSLWDLPIQASGRIRDKSQDGHTLCDKTERLKLDIDGPRQKKRQRWAPNARKMIISKWLYEVDWWLFFFMWFTTSNRSSPLHPSSRLNRFMYTTDHNSGYTRMKTLNYVWHAINLCDRSVYSTCNGLVEKTCQIPRPRWLGMSPPPPVSVSSSHAFTLRGLTFCHRASLQRQTAIPLWEHSSLLL